MLLESHTPGDRLSTIREMCDDYGVTARTLRFYEQKELLFPLREGQKRLFSKRDRARLKLILRGKRFGFPLEEIRQLLDLYDSDADHLTQLEQTYEVAQRHLGELKAQRKELDEAVADLQDQIKSASATIERLRSETIDDNRKDIK